MAVTEDTVVKAFREGGGVIRCHARPRLREYTVGQHAFNVAGLISIFNPGASSRLLRAALWHDVPERWLGDIPTPLKQMQPDLGGLIKSAEEEIFELLGVDFNLTKEEKIWLKAADMLELFIYAREEIALGNKSAISLARDTIKIIDDLIKNNKFPSRFADYVDSIRESNHMFLPDSVDYLRTEKY